MSNSATSWTAARQASLSVTNSQSLLKLTSIKSVMPSNHLILCCHSLSSHLQSFPASGSFPMSQFFESGGQNNGASASASVLPMNIQDWFPLGLTGWISFKDPNKAGNIGQQWAVSPQSLKERGQREGNSPLRSVMEVTQCYFCLILLIKATHKLAQSQEASK